MMKVGDLVRVLPGKENIYLILNMGAHNRIGMPLPDCVMLSTEYGPVAMRKEFIEVINESR
jgi:hypothetical protein